MTYPTSPDYASGRFRGPIDAPTSSFPDASPTNQIYVNLAEWQRWQLEVQIARDQAASQQFENVSNIWKSLGATPPPNPYMADMETLAMQLAALPALV